MKNNVLSFLIFAAKCSKNYVMHYLPILICYGFWSADQMLHVLVQHPFVHPIIEVDFMVDKSLVVVISPISARGSLKDFIYRVSITVCDMLSVMYSVV